MKANLDHLPAVQQDELRRITDLLLRGFEAAIACGAHPGRRGAKALKITLFGSYARDHLVDLMQAVCGARLAELQRNSERGRTS